MAKKVKLPKRVAGVKVPKELRRTVERAIEAAQGPAAQEMIAAALTVAAAAATTALVRARNDREGGADGASPVPPRPPRPPRPPVPPLAPVGGTPPRPPFPPEGSAAAVDPKVAIDAIGQVADQVLKQLFGGRR